MLALLAESLGAAITPAAIMLVGVLSLRGGLRRIGRKVSWRMPVVFLYSLVGLTLIDTAGQLFLGARLAAIGYVIGVVIAVFGLLLVPLQWLWKKMRLWLDRPASDIKNSDDH